MKKIGNLDLITIGRSSVDLYGSQIGGRLEDMRSFQKYIGGSPTNIAAGAARLGLKTAVITRVCLLYTSPSPRDRQKSRMPSSA